MKSINAGSKEKNDNQGCEETWNPYTCHDVDCQRGKKNLPKHFVESIDERIRKGKRALQNCARFFWWSSVVVSNRERDKHKILNGVKKDKLSLTVDCLKFEFDSEVDTSTKEKS